MKKIFILLLTLFLLSSCSTIGKIKDTKESLNAFSDKRLAQDSSALLNESQVVLAQEIADTTKLFMLYDQFLVDLKTHIDEVNELAKTSESEKCKEINPPDLYQTHEAFAGQVQKLREMPTGTEDEFTAFKITMGSVNLQVPIIGLSINSARGFCTN